MRKLGVVLLSGGLDSTTVATLAKGEGFELSALTVRYGQVHEKEVTAACRVAEILGIPHRVLDIPLYGELAWHSSLTSPRQFDIPKGRSVSEMERDIPTTYVPLRNTMLLSLAAAWLESQALAAIEEERMMPKSVEAAIFIAVNAIDYSGYPDCRPEFYGPISEVFRLGSKLGVQYGVSIHIQTPLIRLSKPEIVQLAQTIGAPLQHTWSCYYGAESPCGRCDSCLLRAKGFGDAGLADPALALVT